jgi:hypothetical protein
MFARCWNALIAQLENEPGYWAVRDVQRDLFWRNKAAREMGRLNAPAPALTNWAGIGLAVHHPDVARSEDCVSLCLKTRQPQSLIIRVRFRPEVLTRCRLSICPVPCQVCGEPCPLLVGHLAPLSGEMPSPSR